MDMRELVEEVGSSKEFEVCDCRDIFGKEHHVFRLRYLPQALWERYQEVAMKRLKREETKGLQVLIVTMSLCDETGEPAFDYKKQEELERVARIKAAILARLSRKAQEMNTDTEESMRANAGNFASGMTDDFS